MGFKRFVNIPRIFLNYNSIYVRILTKDSVSHRIARDTPKEYAAPKGMFLFCTNPILIFLSLRPHFPRRDFCSESLPYPTIRICLNIPNCPKRAGIFCGHRTKHRALRKNIFRICRGNTAADAFMILPWWKRKAAK